MIAPPSVEDITLDFQQNDNGFAADPGINFPRQLEKGQTHLETTISTSTSSSWPLPHGFYVVKTYRLIRPA
jgi:hypothetical protein